MFSDVDNDDEDTRNMMAAERTMMITGLKQLEKHVTQSVHNCKSALQEQSAATST